MTIFETQNELKNLIKCSYWLELVKFLELYFIFVCIAARIQIYF